MNDPTPLDRLNEAVSILNNTPPADLADASAQAIRIAANVLGPLVSKHRHHAPTPEPADPLVCEDGCPHAVDHDGPCFPPAPARPTTVYVIYPDDPTEQAWLFLDEADADAFAAEHNLNVANEQHTIGRGIIPPPPPPPAPPAYPEGWRAPR